MIADSKRGELPGLSGGLRGWALGGGQVQALPGGGWRLAAPAGPAGAYRLAQIDDYGGLRRRAFPRRPGFSLALQARASHSVIPGTWGFGLWNEPFGMGVMNGGELLRLPALPQSAWFFFAAPPNYLSLRDDLPAQGGLAAVFRSRRIPTWLLAPGALGLPLLAWPRFGRLARRLGRGVVREAGAALSVDPTEWHAYHLEWGPDRCRLAIDEQPVLETPLAPHGPLGIVIWLDNQFAAATPSGQFGWGTLDWEEAAWVEIRELRLG